MPILAADDIRKSYAGVRALAGVSFALEPGEVHALVGENGAGKSTLIRILTGAEHADAGTLDVDARPVDLAHFTPARARALGIAVVHQQPALFPDLTVTENIALALGDGRAWRPIDWLRRRDRARQLLEQAGALFDPDRLAGSLSMPEQQLLGIAWTIGADARIVLMDEPTASLTDREVDRLFSVVNALRARGVAIVYISHRLDEVVTLADRTTVLRDGESVASAPRGAIARDDIVRLMAGREVFDAPPARQGDRGSVALAVCAVTSADAGVRDVTFEVRRGEILGIAGLVGAGRTELAEVLFGLRPLDSGTIAIDGRQVAIECPADAIAQGLAYVPEDRRRHGVVLDLPIAANVSLAHLGAVSMGGLIRREAERDSARRFVHDLHIKAHDVDAPVSTLSGGNQQKVALARWLGREPSVLILDEPTQGVDIGAKSEIHAIMRQMVERGLAVVMISSELPELLAMSDSIAVMRGGMLVDTFDSADATAERILSVAVGEARGGATV